MQQGRLSRHVGTESVALPCYCIAFEIQWKTLHSLLLAFLDTGVYPALRDGNDKSIIGKQKVLSKAKYPVALDIQGFSLRRR